MIHIATTIRERSNIHLDLSLDELRSLPDDAQRQRFAKALKIFEADFAMREIDGFIQLTRTYSTVDFKPCAPAGVPIVLFRCDMDFHERSRQDADTHTPDLGWRKWGIQVNIEPVSGGHLSMMSPPHVQVLADALKAFLTHVDSKSEPTSERSTSD